MPLFHVRRIVSASHLWQGIFLNTPKIYPDKTLLFSPQLRNFHGISSANSQVSTVHKKQYPNLWPLLHKPCFSCKSEHRRHPIPYQIFALGAKEQFLYYRYDFLHMLQSLDVITNHIILDPCPLKKGSISCPEASVRNYHYTLRNDPEEWSSHFHVGVPK